MGFCYFHHQIRPQLQKYFSIRPSLPIDCVRRHFYVCSTSGMTDLIQPDNPDVSRDFELYRKSIFLYGCIVFSVNKLRHRIKLTLCIAKVSARS